MGLDSLMAVELSNRLQRNLKQPLPSTMTFEHPTIESLTEYLAVEVLAITTKSAAEGSARNIDEQRRALSTELQGIPDDKLEDALLKELKDAGY
jgi:hypothetical protein